MSSLALAGCSSSDTDAEDPEDGNGSDTPTGTTRPGTTEAPTEPGTDSQGTETPSTGDGAEEVEFYHAGNASTGVDGGEITGVLPSLTFSTPVTLDETVSFTVENLDTDRRVSVDPSGEFSVDADGVSLFVYGPRGELRQDNASLSIRTVEQEAERVGVVPQGDESTFTEPERATYRTTMFRGGTEVGATEHEMTIGHRAESDLSVGEDAIEISVNAGTLPTGGPLSAGVRTDDGRTRANEVSYDEATARFVATFARDAIPPGEQRANFRITNPDTERTDFNLPLTVDIPEDGNDDETSDGITLEFSDPGMTQTDDGTIVGASPAFSLPEPATIDESVALVTENLDTGNSVRFEVAEEASLEARYLSTRMHDGAGTLQPDRAVLAVLTPDREGNLLGASLQGDETTFSDLERATYRTTMRRDGARVGATEYEMTVGHQREYEQSVGEDTIEIGFNAGTLPTDGPLFGVVRPGDTRVEAADTGYDADAHRFYATFDAADVPPGDHRATLRVANPATGNTEFSLSATLTVADN